PKHPCSSGRLPPSKWQFCAKPRPSGGAPNRIGAGQELSFPMIAVALAAASSILNWGSAGSHDPPLSWPSRHFSQALSLVFLKLSSALLSRFWQRAAEGQTQLGPQGRPKTQMAAPGGSQSSPRVVFTTPSPQQAQLKVHVPPVSHAEPGGSQSSPGTFTTPSPQKGQWQLSSQVPPDGHAEPGGSHSSPGWLTLPSPQNSSSAGQLIPARPAPGYCWQTSSSATSSAARSTHFVMSATEPIAAV